MQLLGIVFIASIAAQTTTPISPECQAFVNEQAKALDSQCGGQMSVGNSTLDKAFGSVVQSLPKLCSVTCGDSLKSLVEKVKANSACANQQGLLQHYEAIKNAACIKTVDGKAYCLERQAGVLEPIMKAADPSNPASVVFGILSNKELICTDCAVKQIDALKDIPEVRFGDKDPRDLLSETCEGKFKTVPSSDNTSGVLGLSISFIAVGALFVTV